LFFIIIIFTTKKANVFEAVKILQNVNYIWGSDCYIIQINSKSRLVRF